MAIPLTALGSADTGDRLTIRAFYQEMVEIDDAAHSVDMDRLPGTGPAVVSVPDLGTTTILIDIADPLNDDYGPGTYTYPSDPVFSPGNFDVTNFQVGIDDENVVFRFLMRGPVDNSWDSPNGVSLQTFDVYIDADGDGQGGVSMLPGRNLSFEDGTAWDYAITVEGWFPGVFVPGEEGPQRIAEASEFQVLADPGQQKVTIRVPKSILGDDPENWSYAAVVMSQEGFPSGGVMRVRDVTPVVEQWRVGGAPAGAANHTRVIDLVWANPGDQENWLGNFEPLAAPQGDLTAGDFAQVPMFGAE
jgi:carbohydrate-binding DOMON domain-containing protein